MKKSTTGGAESAKVCWEGWRAGFGSECRATCKTCSTKRSRSCSDEPSPNDGRRWMHCFPELYLHGLAEGDFDWALRGLLGEETPLSAATVARLKSKWQTEFEGWSARALSELEVVYLWADGIYVKAGLEKEKAAMLVVVAGLSDGQKVVLAVRSGYRESTESGSALLRDLKARGLKEPRRVMADGHLGIWDALAGVDPRADEQRCWNHRILHVLDQLPTKAQAEGREWLTQIPYAESRKQAEGRKGEFQAWCRRHGHEKAAARLDHDWERMVTFYTI